MAGIDPAAAQPVDDDHKQVDEQEGQAVQIGKAAVGPDGGLCVIGKSLAHPVFFPRLVVKGPDHTNAGDVFQQDGAHPVQQLLQALEQGRDVYAVPGAPYDGRSDGCNKLLKDGATLVDSADDIVENFNFSEVTFTPRILEKVSETDDLFEYSLDKPENNSDSPKQNNEYDKLLSLISSSGEDIDELIRTMDLPTEKVLTMIVELELDDKITRLPGNRVGKI